MVGGGTLLSKKRMAQRRTAMEQRRSPHLSNWKSIQRFIRPGRGQFLGDQNNDTADRASSMVNSTPAVASRTLRAGMMAGAASPSYRWFKFFTQDDGFKNWNPARVALEARETIVFAVLAKSNFYQNLVTLFGDSGDFGNGHGLLEKHPRDIIALRTLAPGSYLIDCDIIGDVNCLYFSWQETAINLIAKYGKDKVGDEVRRAYDASEYSQKFKVHVCVEENVEFDPERADWAGKPWVRFTYLDTNDKEGESEYLELSGYNEYPFAGLRWEIPSGNIWAEGPGLTALGDSIALQTYEFRDAQAIERGVKPPLQAPTALKTGLSHVPGAITYYSPFETNNAKAEPIYTISPGILTALDNKITKHEMRINEAYYKDLFLMLSQTDRREITAREVEEKHEEKLLNLGPVLQRTHRDALSRAIIRTYRACEEAGLFPEGPPELQGQSISIEYTSALAYAQRAVGATAIERFFGFTGNIAPIFPQARHKINVFKAIDNYADSVGVPAEVMVASKDAQAAADAEAQAQSLPQQAAAAKDMASSAQIMSQTDTTRPSALDFLLNQAGG